MQDFRGKVAVVTGGASGIGFALARRFGREGMKIVLADIEDAALAGAIEKLESEGFEALGVRTDVSNADSLANLAEQTLQRFGGAHILCNNAGVLTAGLSWESPLSDYEWTFGVNIWGVIHGVRTFVPIMLEQDTECHVINTSSMAGVTTLPFTSIYHMSKHAVLAYSESLYHELNMREAKIGVSALCPEAIATAIGRSERNRPSKLSEDGPVSTESKIVNQALKDTVDKGVKPEVIADRVLEAVRENRFYILSEDVWRDAAHTRLDDVRLARNPTFTPPLS
ncbi:MAG: SDR family NAD(P)-dependent oxidoreductase [bacterium]|nr:SDR family NAD(P)-dependent oxidoreductase [bacterium]